MSPVIVTDPEAVEELRADRKEEVSLFVEIVQSLRDEWRHRSKWVAVGYAALTSAIALLMVGCVASLFLLAGLLLIHFTRTVFIILAGMAVLALFWGALFVVVPDGEKLRDYDRGGR